MNLEALAHGYFASRDDSGLDNILRQILEPFRKSIARTAMVYFNKVNSNPHSTVVEAHKIIDQLHETAGPTSKLSILARRRFPDAYEKGIALMDKIHGSLSEAMEELIGDPRHINENNGDWIKTQKLSLETHIMIESIASPLIKTASAVDVKQINPKAAFMAGILDWFTGIKELCGD